MDRRDFLRAGAAAAVAGGFENAAFSPDVPVHFWEGHDFGPGPPVPDRLNQGPFGGRDVANWATIASTSPSGEHIRNYGLGLVGYAWEEAGPSLAARRGEQSLEDHVTGLAALPFVDVLYIRCDWRDVQSRPGRLDLHPVWKLAIEEARRHGLRIAFRIMASNTVGQPGKLALPDFLQERVPIADLGPCRDSDYHFREPRWDSPKFLDAFRELNGLLAAEFDSNPLTEFIDLMMWGFWGEAHNNGCGCSVPDRLDAERAFAEMTAIQLDTWKHVPLAVNTQPGNRNVLDMAVRGGCWLRSDSIIHDEPIQIERLANRPPWLAVAMEQGWRRDHDIDQIPVDSAGVNAKEKSMLMSLSLRANYWALWTEAENLRRYSERWPAGIEALQRRLGYRVRPGWVWQREKHGRPELIVGFVNDGVAGVPGVLRVTVSADDGSWSAAGCLDAGRPLGGGVRQASWMLPKTMFGRRVLLRAELITNGVSRPLRWACAREPEQDGSFAVQLEKQGELTWGRHF